MRKTHIKTKQLSPRSLDKLLQSFFKFNIEMKERKRKRKRYESSESSDLLNSSSSSFSSSSSSSSSSLSFSSSSSSSSSSKRRKKSSDKKSRRRKEKRKRKEKKKKKKEKKCDADSKRQRRKRREEEGAEVVELDSKKKKRKCETLDKKEITEITTGAPPSAPRDEDISDKNNRQHEGKDEVKRSDAPAPVDATPPVPGFGAAMTPNNIASSRNKRRIYRARYTRKIKQKRTQKIKINKRNYPEDGGRARATSATVT